METQFKNRLIALARWTVTVAAIVCVLLKIEWRDRLVLADGTVLSGRITAGQGQYLVVAADGRDTIVSLDRIESAGGVELGFITLFRSIRPLYLLVGLAVYPLSNILGAIRWRKLMTAHGMDPGLTASLRLTWLGFFWSLVFPGVTGGDVVKAYCVARTARKRAVAVLIVLLDRVIGIVGLALLSGIVILLNLQNPELRTVSAGILVFILVMVGTGLLFFSRRLRRWFGLEWFLKLLPFQAHVSQLDDALFQYRYHKDTIVWSVVLSLGTHVVNVGIFCLAGAALGLPVAWQHYFVFIPVMLMIAALPISAGGLGVFETGVAHFLTLRGVGATASGAFALCVLYRVMTIIVGLPGALGVERGPVARGVRG
jgi:hypothetical protein